MVDLAKVVESAIDQNKNILILGSARSGTHPLGKDLLQIHNKAILLGEICSPQHSDRPWQEIEKIYDHSSIFIAHLVSYVSKIYLCKDIQKIKDHALIINIRRHDKVKQFASWIYFRHIGAIYNFDHAGQDWIPQHSITATVDDIEQFIAEQTIDDFFIPDAVIEYEKYNFLTKSYKKNQYAYPIEEIFSNLDFVKQNLTDFRYCAQHLTAR